MKLHWSRRLQREFKKGYLPLLLNNNEWADLKIISTIVKTVQITGNVTNAIGPDIWQEIADKDLNKIKKVENVMSVVKGDTWLEIVINAIIVNRKTINIIKIIDSIKITKDKDAITRALTEETIAKGEDITSTSI